MFELKLLRSDPVGRLQNVLLCCLQLLYPNKVYIFSRNKTSKAKLSEIFFPVYLISCQFI